MAARWFHLFDTPIGRCGVAWSPDGLAGVLLPAGSDASLEARMRRRHPQAQAAEPPAEVRTAVERIGALLRGEPAELGEIRLDTSGVGEFERRVYELARTIPPGRTASYGALARQLEDPAAAQAVGQAMGRNPFPIVVPCHRVLAADGSLGGFSAPGGVATKRRLLEIEGSPAAGPPMLFADERLPSAAVR